MAQERARFSIGREVGLHNTDLLEGALRSLPGVTSVEIDRGSCGVTVGFDAAAVSREAIQAKIEILGYPVQRS